MTAKTYIGKICEKHPSFAGERHTRNGSCVQCQRDYAQRWAENNLEKKRAAYIAWAAKNPDQIRQRHVRRYAANGKSELARNRNWCKRNPQKAQAIRANRRASKLNATPSWADKEAIRRFYLEAWRLTQNTGVKHEVDHIVPLRSKRVCGFHTHTNLQVVPKSVNLQKGNRHWPDMPS